ncbi:response regulator [Sinimarinibacterium sp. NLF-5-8]|uniref:response regulator n=1 Tax=Sinimarinibacterium sp. NLF-5-8 TaxID=2698684 RepID=UPI00137C2584|nr:response regulator [Sinimarinibacterium sp. NLF-5-8]QHS10244.1 response regulator [Sinimarinibacterium sp. NLF-5-8]
MSARILVVEDEPKLAALLRDYLQHAGYAVQTLARGDGVQAQLAQSPVEVLLLDVQLPGKDGLSICRDLRAAGSTVAIIMITARVDEVDRLLGLELGADDYICKPFSPREVVARVKAVLRRMQVTPHETDDAMQLGVLWLDEQGYRARAGGVDLELTPIEFRLLHAFMQQPQRVWSRAQLLDRARGTDFAGYERNIDSHVKNLRKKLRHALDDQDPIRSVYGVGYGLDADVLEA